MTFKSIRHLIYSPLELIIGDMHVENVDTHASELDIYDDYEVIGIRAGVDIYTNKHFEYDNYEPKVVISLKESLTTIEGLGNPYHNEDKYKRYDNISICKN